MVEVEVEVAAAAAGDDSPGWHLLRNALLEQLVMCADCCGGWALRLPSKGLHRAHRLNSALGRLACGHTNSASKHASERCVRANYCAVL
jgi:hypothetical protein